MCAREWKGTFSNALACACAGPLRYDWGKAPTEKYMRFILALLALFLLASCAGSDAISERQYGQLMVCHENQSIYVSTAHMFVHENHGDSLGPCPGDD